MSDIGGGSGQPGAQGAPHQPPGVPAPYPQAGAPAAHPSAGAPAAYGPPAGASTGYGPPPGAPAGYAPPPQRPGLLPAALPAPNLGYAESFAPLERRPGRWFLAWAIALGFFAAGQVATLAALMPRIGEAFSKLDPEAIATNPDAAAEPLTEALSSWSGLLAVNLSWAVMIPGAIFAMAAYGKRGWGYVMSVIGRWRWGVVGRAALTIVPIFAVYIGSMLMLDETVEWQWNPNWALVVVVLLTTPLQSTGEEFAFRGFLTQQLAGWVRKRWVPVLAFAPMVLLAMVAVGSMGGLHPSVLTAQVVALLAAAIGPWISGGRPLPTALWVGISTGLLFGSMHGHPAFTATLQLSLVGFACSMLTYRTGGLESASVLHVANNVFIMLPLALTGTSALSGAVARDEDFLSLGMAIAALTLAYVAVHFTMRKVESRTAGVPGAELLLERPAPVAPGAPGATSVGGAR